MAEEVKNTEVKEKAPRKPRTVKKETVATEVKAAPVKRVRTSKKKGVAGQYIATGRRKDAVARGAHAGKIVGRVAAVTGGKGGGRPDSAMAGIGKTYMVDEALAAFESIVKDFIN